MKATRPLQYVCVFSVEMPTMQGDVFAYMAMDVYSEFLIKLDIEPDREINGVLKNVKLLMDDKDFKKHRGKGFTLVFHKYEQHRKEIENIIAPLGGKMMVDEVMILEKMIPAIEQLYLSMTKGQPNS